MENVDTTIYRKMKCGLYIDSAGNICQKSGYFLFGQNNEEQNFSYMADDIIVGEYDNRVKYKNSIDTNTFIQFENTNFEKDKKHVYYWWGTSDGLRKRLFEEADAKTFVGIKGRYGKDKRNVYYRTEKVNGANLKTFEVLEISNHAKDKNHYYEDGERIDSLPKD